MADTVYEFIATRNARLAKFTDHNPNIAQLFMKLITHFEIVSRERSVDPRNMRFEATGSPDGKMVAVKVAW